MDSTRIVDSQQAYIRPEVSDATAKLWIGLADEDVELVREAIKEGADVRSKDGLGRIPYHFTYVPELRALLTEALISPETITLIKGAQEGNLETVTKALAQGADINGSPDGIWNALRWAVSDDHREVVSYLVEQKADLDTGSPINLAAFKGLWDVVKILAAGGASLNVNANFADYPLYTACHDRDEKMIKMLLEARSDVNLPGNNSSCLHALLFRGYRNRGADLRERVLFHSILSRKEPTAGCLRLLVEAKADFTRHHEYGLDVWQSLQKFPDDLGASDSEEVLKILQECQASQKVV